MGGDKLYSRGYYLRFTERLVFCQRSHIGRLRLSACNKLNACPLPASPIKNPGDNKQRWHFLYFQNIFAVKSFSAIWAYWHS